MPVNAVILNRARELRAAQTIPEAILWHCLRDRRLGGLKFRRQHPVKVSYITDFFCYEAGLVVELDGASHDGRVEYDAARTADLAAMGYAVLRFKNRDLDALERVLAAIEREARSRIADRRD